MNKVFTEIPPLSERDCFYIVERHKSEFLFPLHCHREYELNFIEGGKGVRRIVGDSVEQIGDYELTLVTSPTLAHAWEQGICTSGDVREITIQFHPDLFSERLLDKTQFQSIQLMFKRAERGLSFPIKAIMKVYPLLDSLSAEKDSFDQLWRFMRVLYELSNSPGARELASTSFADVREDEESRRITRVKQYVEEHYAEQIRLGTLASLAGMTPSAFSRYFRQHTGRTVVDYIVDIRLGHAARLLIDTTDTVSEICYQCGFNNLSNFNRTFRSRRGSTPRDFRTLFRKNRVFV